MKRQTIGIVGVPQDLGASRRGVDMGASAMRIAGLTPSLQKLGYEVVDYGNIRCHDLAEKIDYEQNVKLRFLNTIVDTCQHLKDTVNRIIDDGAFPLVLGGDHSISIGTLAGMLNLHGGRTGIIWVDAHGDFNTHLSTHSGNIHGMPFAAILDRGHKALREIGPSPTALEENSVLFAARDLDPEERELLIQSKVTIITMRDIDEMGIASAARKAIEIATRGVDYLHVSFDIDALDPREAPGTGTPVTGGLTFREAHLLMEMVHDSGKLSSFEMVEVNPTLDYRNQTAKLAVGLIASALGKRIV